jgi:hypothetical protein
LKERESERRANIFLRHLFESVRNFQRKNLALDEKKRLLKKTEGVTIDLYKDHKLPERAALNIIFLYYFCSHPRKL